MTIHLEPILAHLPAWLMVLFRITGIFLFAPLLGATTIPMRVKLGLAIGLSLCVYPVLLMPSRASFGLITPWIDGQTPLHLWTIVPMIALELLVGLVIGYGASLPIVAAQVGGHVIDQQIGLGLAGVYNPELNEQSGVIGEFFFLSALAVFILLGGHHAMLATLVSSFDRVPPGGFTDFAGILTLVCGLLMSMFELALRVSAPLLAVVFLETVAMGFVARTVPQLNILSIGFALRILVGLAVLIVMVSVQMPVIAQSIRQTLGRIAWFFAL